MQVVAAVKPPAGRRQGPRDDRPATRGEARPAGTSGAAGGTGGREWRVRGLAWTIGAAMAAMVCTFNVLTRLHDAPGQGVLQPLVLEGSSFLTTVIAFTAPAAVAIWAARGAPRPLPILAAAHLGGFLAYALLHIGGFWGLRSLACPLILHHAFDPGPLSRELPYEMAKDALAYALCAATFRLLLGWAPAQGAPAAEATPAVFDIRDGARLVRAPLSDILAVRSAGNYVEFRLRDGRTPLMRSPLSAVEGQLAAAGFVRTHRSWLVNGALVTGLRPEGSGDYAVELGELEAPLSRRFPQALAALRG